MLVSCAHAEPIARRHWPLGLIYDAQTIVSSFRTAPSSSLSGAPLRPRADLLRALRPYVEAQIGEGVSLKHIVRHVLGLFHGQAGGRLYRQVLSEGAHLPGADWSLVEQALAVTEASAARHAA